MIVAVAPLRFATSWQRIYCETCREETNHYRNACVHCGEKPGAKTQTVTVPVQYNGRGVMPKLSEEQRVTARRMLNSGTPPKTIAAKMGVSPSSIYRLNPLTRG